MSISLAMESPRFHPSPQWVLSRSNKRTCDQFDICSFTLTSMTCSDRGVRN